MSKLKRLVLNALETNKLYTEFEDYYKDRHKGTIYYSRKIVYRNKIKHLLTEINKIRYGTINQWEGIKIDEKGRETNFNILLSSELSETHVINLLWITEKVKIKELKIISSVDIGIITEF